MAGAYIDVAAAIKEAERLLAEKTAATEKVAIIRTDLRNAVTMGVANTEQRVWIETQFPIRERKTKKDTAPVVAKAA